MDADPVVDWLSASRTIPGGAQGVRKLAQMMCAECPRMIGEVRRGIAEGDAPLVRLSAHTLRGAARYFSARQVIDAAGAMEDVARAGDLRAAREALPQLEAAVHALADALANPQPDEEG